ncbi:MAG: hydantoinase/oxoprolinase family protein [Panacagrimonas sp.]
MAKLINIDNGGTLTDICVIDGSSVLHTKTLTTPYDLSKCFVEGLRKAAKLIYGKDDQLDELLLSTDHVRYSTTQGTNAIVERKGPQLGLIHSPDLEPAALRRFAEDGALFDALVGQRVMCLDLSADEKTFETRLAAAVTGLVAVGANRIVVSFGGADSRQQEARFKDVALRKFPRQLLGVVPILCACDLVEDADALRRTWTALLNAFLHPVMESFLYSAEGILREHYHRHPLLIFRNDGDSSRVARTVALKTYSSGPRGGMEGAKALAAHYGAKRLLSMDIGGTTTDIGLIEDGSVRAHARGRIEGVSVSLPLCDVVSVGVGGSSILKVVDGRIKVGPESTGGAPGPACFGLGGQLATITDVFLLNGLIDPATYFGGAMRLDRERAQAAVETHIATPLRLKLAEALAQAERAWGMKVAETLKRYCGGTIGPDTVLAAFGGAGPFIVTAVAEAAGISKAIIPGLAAVFSAFGIGFSDIAHNYEAPTSDEARELLIVRARRDMFAEGFELEQCALSWETREERLHLRVVKSIHHARIDSSATVAAEPARSTGVRTLAVPGHGTVKLPIYRVEDQPPGACGEGPCILEEAYFTGRIDAGWRFEIRSNRDTVLTRIDVAGALPRPAARPTDEPRIASAPSGQSPSYKEIR